MLVWAYDLYQTNPIKVERDWVVLSWSAESDDGRIITKCLADYKGYKKDPFNDKDLITELYQLIDEHDILIAHNGDSFDIKKINERFICHGLLPTSPYKSVDTLRTARSKFKFSSNRLDYICQKLGIGAKIENEKDLWHKCYWLCDPSAWEKMKRYNRRDVLILKKLEQIFLPWIDRYPTPKDGNLDCPNCHSIHFQKSGPAIFQGVKTHRFRCMDCGTNFYSKL